MVVVTEVLVGAMIEKLVETAYNYIANKVKDRITQSRMNAEVDKLNKALPKIQAILSAAEKVGVSLDEMDPMLTAWMWQLRDAVDAADNLLDDIEYQKLDKEFESEDDNASLTKVELCYESDSKGVKMCCSAFLSKCTMKNMKRALIDGPILVRLREVMKQLDEVAAHVGEFVQLVALSEQCASRDDMRAEIARDRETSFLPIEKILFGRAEEKEELTKWLLSPRLGEESKSESSVSILAIVGVGGIGKSSLAQDIYNDANVDKYFTKKMWICVSNTFDVPTILGKIVQSSGQSLSTLQEKVMTELSPERFLIVLDDVWDDKNPDCWKKLVGPLQSGKSGSKIILTTRMDSVAKMARDAMEGSKHLQHNLKGLNKEMSALLLDKHAFVGFNRADYSQLQPVIMNVAKKLGGVPLLIKAVGGVLNSNLELGHWKHILNSNAMNLTMNNNKVLNVLKLSYQNLPTKVQSCFRFCSIFPEDYDYTEEELVGMWVALGMIPQSQNGYDQPEDIGKDYFNILVRKSFLIVNGEFDDGCKLYVMHDCMHQMASIVSKGECLGVNNINLKEFPETIRHLFIKSKDVSVLADMCPPRNLQTLIMHNFYWHEYFPPLNKFFKRLTNLRVLKLHWRKMDDLSVVNADLKHLRYVDIYSSSSNLQRIPNCFRKLYYSQVIYLELLGIEKAFAGEHNPIYNEITMHKAFFKLLKLRHFYIRDQYDRKWLPTFFPGIGRLTLLQEIGIFTLKDKDGYKLNELTNMNSLNSSLNIAGLEIVKSSEEAKEARLTDKKCLYSLKLEWRSNGSPIRDKCRSELDAQLSDFLEPPCSLNELTIKGYDGLRLPYWLEIGCPKYLVSLSFIDCGGMSQLPLLSCFRSIKFVELQNLPLVKKMPPVPLSLEKLKISGVGLVSLPTFWLDSESTSLITSASLSSLVINDCQNLPSLAQGLFQQQNMTALEELEITECEELVRFPDAGLMDLTSLKSLRIEFNQSLEIIPSMYDKLFPTSLNRLVISGQVEGVLHNLLRSLTSLSCLHLIELNVTSLLQEFCSFKLDSLEDLKILKCGKLKSLDDFYVAASLQRLAIKECSKLEVVSFQIEDDHRSSSTLEKLNIKACDELKSVELHGLTSLKEIMIVNCPTLATINRHLKSDSSQSITPSIVNNSSSKNLSEIRELRDLESLTITDCAGLASLSFMVGLKSVNWLDISKCPKLLGAVLEEKLVSEVGQEFSKDEDNTLSVNHLNVDCASLLLCHPLRNVTSVRDLWVTGDLQLHPLPEFFLLQNRTSLRDIHLHDSSHLEFLPARLQDLTMLKVLCIYNAKKLKSLPELPGSLQTLEITGCTSEFKQLYQRNTGENWSKIAYISDVSITN